MLPIAVYQHCADTSKIDVKTEVGSILTQHLKTQGKGVAKQATPSSHYGSASTWPPRKEKWRRIVDDWMSIKEEVESPDTQPSLTCAPEEREVGEQSRVPKLQALYHQPVGSLLLEWQDCFNRSSEESAGPSSNASTLVSSINNKFNLPAPPSDWVPPKSAWSDTTAASIRERDGRGLRSRLRSLSLTRALRRVMERSPSPSRDTDTKIAQIIDDHDAKLSAVRAETHHKIVSKKVKRRRASEPGVKPKQRYQDIIEASAILQKRVLRRSVPEEKQLLGRTSEGELLEKDRPMSLPISKAPKLNLNTFIVPWV